MQYRAIMEFGLKQTDSFLTGPKCWAFHLCQIPASPVTNGTMLCEFVKCVKLCSCLSQGLLRAYNSPGNRPAPNRNVMGAAYIVLSIPVPILKDKTKDSGIKFNNVFYLIQ